MRALFTFAGGSGHFLPTVPFAHALRERGHEVMYSCQEAMVPVVNSAGWLVAASGGNTLLDPQARRPLVAVDRVAEKSTIRRTFAGTIARERTGRLLEIAAEWRPDLIVRDEMDFAGAVAAEVLNLPHAAVAVIAAGGLLRTDVVEEPLASLRADHGLDPAGDAMAMLHRHLTIVPAPPSFRDPADPLPRTAHCVRPAVLDQGEGPWPESGGSTRPTPGRAKVYVTLGTIFNQESGDLFGRVLAGLADLPVEVIATVGHQIDPSEVGHPPPNVRVEPFIPLADVLADTDVVVSHGGSGTVIAALAFGIPQVVLPLGADQPLNADRCVALGVGIALDALDSTPTAIGEATVTLLWAQTYRARANQVRAEIASLPDARHAAALLERLAGTRAPAHRT
ncbi:MAG: glycosyltransferase [Acidimicrobiales bacterium]